MALGAAAALGAYLAVAIPSFAFPPQDRFDRVDVAFVIGPAEEWRLDLARELVESGHAGVILVSRPVYTAMPICDQPQSVPVVCLTPDPSTTLGEATLLDDAMKQNGWSDALVITSTPHTVRTRVVMDRCVDGSVAVIGRADGIGAIDWVYSFVYQSAAFAKLVLTPGCP